MSKSPVTQIESGNPVYNTSSTPFIEEMAMPPTPSNPVDKAFISANEVKQDDHHLKVVSISEFANFIKKSALKQ